MTSPALLGLDPGTSSVKVSIVSADGSGLRSYRGRSYAPHRPARSQPPCYYPGSSSRLSSIQPVQSRRFRFGPQRPQKHDQRFAQGIRKRIWPGRPGRPYQCDPHSPGEPAGLSRRHRIPGLDVGGRRREGSSHLELAGDILGVTMHTLDLINSSAREAALMSVAAGSLKSVRRACQTLMRLLGVVTPDPHAHWVHHRHFDRFQATTDGQPGEGLLAR
jgi:hypothetical protein